MQEDKATQVDGELEFSVILPSKLSAGVASLERSGLQDLVWSSVVRSELEQEHLRWTEASCRESIWRWAESHGHWVESP
jgi:hypothetical protein